MSIFVAFALSMKDRKVGNADYFKLHDRINKHKVVEMRGLGLPQGKLRRAKTSDNCTVYVLRNGVRLTKYFFSYLIDAADQEAVDATLKLLGVKKSSVETFEVSP